MKNYYDKQKKLELDKLELKFLYRRKESLKPLVEPKSVMTDKIAIDPGTISPDKNLAMYVDAISLTNKKIEEKKEEIEELDSELIAMEKILRGVHDIEYRIFVMYYIDNLSTRKIARRLGYHYSTISRIIERIRKRSGLPKV